MCEKCWSTDSSPALFKKKSEDDIKVMVEDFEKEIEAMKRRERFRVPNKRVAVEPFPTGAKKVEVRGAVIAPMNQAALTPLRVVFDSGQFREGSIVYVRSNLPLTTTYAKSEAVYEIEGRKFILLPEEEVLVVNRHPDLKDDAAQPMTKSEAK